MVSSKPAGRSLISIVFACCSWLFFLMCFGVLGSFYYDGVNPFGGAIYTLSMLIFPVIGSAISTILFNKKRLSHIKLDIVDHEAEDAPAHKYQITLNTDTPQTTMQFHCDSSPDTSSESIRAYVVEYVVNQFKDSTPSSDQVTALDSYSKFGGVDAELLTIDLMEGHDFEYWCAAALRNIGFSDVEVTRGSGDHGVDIVATKDSLKYAIQCKRYTSDIGNNPVQEVFAGKAMYRCHVAAVITNRYFTSGAKELASVNGVLLWDRDWLMQYISSQQDDNGAVIIEHSQSSSNVITTSMNRDELLPAAVDVILETQQASTSMLQRKLKLGYARCARMLDDMENIGIVGPFQGSRPRSIRISCAEWDLICKKLDLK